MIKKIAVSSIVILAYLFTCWFVDLMNSHTIMSASGRSYTIEHRLFYDRYSFNGANNFAYNELILKLDRIFLLGMSVIFLSMQLFKRFSKSYKVKKNI